MRTKKSRPWLTSTGVEIPTAELRLISKGWSRATWESYLDWYDSSRVDALLPLDLYQKRAEQMTASVFEQLGHDTDPKKRELCERLLKRLPPREARVLRHVYFDGLTVREIAAIEKSGKSTIQDRKDRALLRLRRGHGGDDPDTQRYMRGPNHDAEMSTLSFLVKEARVYDPGRFEEELEQVQHAGLRAAMAALSKREQRILYLRFWCDFSVSEIARELRSGVNLIEQVIDAAVSKLKRKLIRHETGFEPGEGPSCA